VRKNFAAKERSAKDAKKKTAERQRGAEKIMAKRWGAKI